MAAPKKRKPRKTNMRGSRGGKAGKKAASKEFKGLSQKANKKSGVKIPVHEIKVRGNQDVWGLQQALRRDGYFARAISSEHVATNAPLK